MHRKVPLNDSIYLRSPPRCAAATLLRSVHNFVCNSWTLRFLGIRSMSNASLGLQPGEGCSIWIPSGAGQA